MGNLTVFKANADLRERYCSVVTKRWLSKNTKLSVFKSVFVPILTCGHGSSMTTERIMSKEETAEMGYLHFVTKSTGLKCVNLAMLVRPCVQNALGRNGERSP